MSLMATGTEAPASQLQLICRYSIDIDPLHHAGLLSFPSSSSSLIIKQTPFGHHTRPSVSIDHCNTTFIKLLTLNIHDETKLAVFEHLIWSWNIIPICFILHIPKELELFLWLMCFFYPCRSVLQRYELVDIGSCQAFNIGKMGCSGHCQPLVPI